MRQIKSIAMCMLLCVCALAPQFPAAAAMSKPNKIEENADLAQAIAEEGTVLLKNDGALPLKKTDVVTGLGVGQDTGQVFGGNGSGWVRTDSTVNYAQGLTYAARSGLIKSYRPIGKPSDAAGSSKVLYFISRPTTEGEDCKRSSYELQSYEKNDLTALIETCGAERIVAVLNVGAVIDTTWLLERNVNAIVLAYLGGERAGSALANVLTGQSVPSGKTADTWAKRYDCYPSSAIGTFAGDRETYYTEDIFVGYRYFETFDPNYETVNFEFGFGLSYTRFELTERRAAVSGGEVSVSANVRNVGAYPGKEVVQAYYAAPQGACGNPARELAGFAKTRLLMPGESQTVTISFPVSDMAVYDDTGAYAENSWVLPAGEYRFYAGNSVRDAGRGGVIGAFTQQADEVLETTTALPQTQLPKRLLASGAYETLCAETAGRAPIRVRPGGATVVQAEDHTAISAGARTETYTVGEDMGFGVGALNTAGQYVEYALNVERAGNYRIAFSMASAWNGQNNMFRLTVNGVEQPLNVCMDATHTETDGDWYRCAYLTDPSYVIALPEGEAVLRFTGNGLSFQNFDCFTLYSETVAAEGETVIEAESAISETLSARHFADGMALGVSSAAGNIFSYRLNVEAAGSYDLSLLASNLTAASADALKIEVNGREQDARVKLKRTAAGGEGGLVSQNYRFTRTDSVYVDLPAGEVALTFTTKDAALACVDKLYLSPRAGAPVVSGGYEENTDTFAFYGDTAGEAGAETVTYADVYADRSKMDAFLRQMSVEELVLLLGVDIANNEIETGVGGVGGYRLDGKYGVPNAYAADGPAGIRYDSAVYYSTWFPCMTMLASTWNADLAEEFGLAVANEGLLGGVNVWLAPGINIHRDPLCGRNFEYFSEDPLVAGVFGTRVTRGAQSAGVSVCVKHFMANNQETNRFANSSCVSVRAMREIYLKGFEIIVKEAHPYAIMSSYNRVNGVYVASSRPLITGVLREDWGFAGAVFSDWEPHMSHISMVQSGNTFKSKTPQYETLVSAYKSGVLTRAQLEANARSAVEFLMLTNCNGQTVTRVTRDAPQTLTRARLTASALTERGYAEFYRIYAVREGAYALAFDGLEAGVAVRVDGAPVADASRVQLSAGAHEIEVCGPQNSVQKLRSVTVRAVSDEAHTHHFVDGYCTECGAPDPDYAPPASEQPSHGPQEQPSGDDGNSALAIGLGVGGGVAAVAAAGVAVCAIRRKRRGGKKKTGQDGPEDGES